MKSFLKKIIRPVATWPLIGRIVRILVAVIRLPELQASHKHQKDFILAVTSELRLDQQEWSRRQLAFEEEQLPTLLQTISNLNGRLVESDKNIQHLLSSVPVALRKITREQINCREQLEGAINGLNEQLSESREQLDGSVNNLTEQLVNLSESAEYLFGRVEFVRRELMFEMKYGTSDPSGGEDQLAAKSEILSPEKLADAYKDKIRLNLGCGHIPLEGYLNVDRRALSGVDIVTEVDNLPFKQGEVDIIYSAHLLEHFPQEQLRRTLLPYYFNLLKVGGEFRAIVPDAEAMIQKYSSGDYPYDDMREVLYGGQEYEGDFHFNMFSPASMTKLLEEAGFVKIRIIEAGRKNGKCLEFEIVAFKPGDRNV